MDLKFVGAWVQGYHWRTFLLLGASFACWWGIDFYVLQVSSLEGAIRAVRIFSWCADGGIVLLWCLWCCRWTIKSEIEVRWPECRWVDVDPVMQGVACGGDGKLLSWSGAGVGIGDMLICLRVGGFRWFMANAGVCWSVAGLAARSAVGCPGPAGVLLMLLLAPGCRKEVALLQGASVCDLILLMVDMLEVLCIWVMYRLLLVCFDDAGLDMVCCWSEIGSRVLVLLLCWECLGDGGGSCTGPDVRVDGKLQMDLGMLLLLWYCRVGGYAYALCSCCVWFAQMPLDLPCYAAGKVECSWGCGNVVSGLLAGPMCVSVSFLLE